MPCALCPHYHTKGISRCKGCSQDGFFTGACNIYKCCKEGEIRHCALCHEYPCKKCEKLKEFNCLNTENVWLRTCATIKEKDFERWYAEYARKAELLLIALENYNNGRMKRYLCELFINNELDPLELIMKKAVQLTGSKEEVGQQFKEIAEQMI